MQDNRLQKLTLISKLTKETLNLYNLYLRTGDGSYVVKQRHKSLSLLGKDISEENSLRCLVGGDFNFITNELDTNNPLPTTQRKDDVLKWLDIEDKFQLYDCFRKIFPSKKVFTKVTNSRTTRRIDRFHSNFKVISYNHIPVGFSDHLLSPGVLINMGGNISWGPGTWKLNSSLINDFSIKTVNKEMWDQFKSIDGEQESVMTWWDRMKQRVRRYYMIKGKQSYEEKKNIISKKEEEINTLINNLSQEQLDSSSRYQSLKKEILEYEKVKYRQYQVRNKIETVQQEMEKPTKSFFNHMTNKKAKSQISAIKIQNGKISEDPKEIMNYITDTYQNLWGKEATQIEEDVQDAYLENVDCNVNDYNVENYISPFINLDEMDEAFEDQYKLDTAPGSDGLTYEFYKSNWNVIKYDLLQVYNNSFISQSLPNSMNEAYVKLIPKQGDQTDIKNWRPLSLLNTDYKILSRIIFNKIVGHLNRHTSKNQKSIFPGRSLISVHLNTVSAIQHSKQHRKHDMAIAKFDLQKAFDNVQHKFLFKMLKKLKLPSSMIQWIKILYKSCSSRLLINGALSAVIQMKKGVKQGCPLSMLLFGIVLEALIQKVNKNTRIKGVFSGSKTILKLQACADDLTFYVTSKSSLDIILQELSLFGKASGQIVNEGKTAIIANGEFILGELQNSALNRKLVNKMKILGIVYTFDETKKDENYCILFKKVERTIAIQQQRNLSMYGKVQILKTKVLPLIFQVLQVLPISKSYVNKLDNLLYKFLWYPNDNEPIPRNELISSYKEGGLGMIDTKSHVMAAALYKLKDIAKATDKTELWIKYSYYNIGTYLRTINPDLFNNFEPLKSEPSVYWKIIKEYFLEFNKENSEVDWSTIKFKEVYNIFRDKNKICGGKDIPWMDVHLMNDKKYMFTNKEREISYLAVHDAIPCGQQRRAVEAFVDIPTYYLNNCKFCHNRLDNVKHILSGECKLIKNIFERCKSLYWMTTKERLILDRKLVLYNSIVKWEGTGYMKQKLVAIIKKVIFLEKRKTRYL